MPKDLQQAISQVLQQDSRVLDMLMLKFKQLKELQSLLVKYLDEKLVSHCQVANCDGKELVILIDSALWATQLRFQTPVLLLKLQEHPELRLLRRISCKIQPGKQDSEALAANRTVAPLSEEAARMVLETANAIQHEKLQAVMRRIAKRTAKDFTRE